MQIPHDNPVHTSPLIRSKTTVLIEAMKTTEDQQIVLPLWPDGTPGSEDWTQKEEELVLQDGLKVVRNVTQPTLTAYLPESAVATGTAAIVCPGGAYHFLSIDKEGTDVARWLNEKGIAVFVLKYRLLHTRDDFPEIVWEHLEDQEAMGKLMDPLWPLLLADGQQAMRVVRSRAAEWNITPNRIGMIGFSAGGTVTVNVSLEHDSLSRPDFAAAIYSADHTDTSVPADAPPLFILCADDDDMASPISVQLYSDWRAANRRVELHIYSRGGHGFGMEKQDLPTDDWIVRFDGWLSAEVLR
jgi:acetyl esterase/lipase